MGILSRLINRNKFRNTLTTDESTNVVDSMVKARRLYKELCIKTHPDRNRENHAVAEELMKKVVASRYDYKGLIQIRKEIKEKIGV